MDLRARIDELLPKNPALAAGVGALAGFTGTAGTGALVSALMLLLTQSPAVAAVVLAVCGVAPAAGAAALAGALAGVYRASQAAAEVASSDSPR